jgi:hypothetical protein
MRTLLRCLAMVIAGTASAGEHADSRAVARAKKDGADFRRPQRDYVAVSGARRIFVEKSLMDRKPELGRRVAAKLEVTLAAVSDRLPEKSKSTLSRVSYHVMCGKDSPQGGRANGMSYIRNGEPNNYPHLDPRWEHSIVIFSADNFMYLDELWTRKSLMHELAHAWHIANWPDRHPPTYDAWRRSRENKLYRNVPDYKGATLGCCLSSDQ